eukprot:jgi/Galph1/2331/GphlegSOOS_G1020.1
MTGFIQTNLTINHNIRGLDYRKIFFASSFCNRCHSNKPLPFVSLPVEASPKWSSPFHREVVSMKKRRDLHKEKVLRNLEFARLHRKKKISKRKVDQETLRVMDDNTFLKEVFTSDEKSD